jgi:hypothetical protein
VKTGEGRGWGDGGGYCKSGPFAGRRDRRYGRTAPQRARDEGDGEYTNPFNEVFWIFRWAQGCKRRLETGIQSLPISVHGLGSTVAYSILHCRKIVLVDAHRGVVARKMNKPQHGVFPDRRPDFFFDFYKSLGRVRRHETTRSAQRCRPFHAGYPRLDGR